MPCAKKGEYNLPPETKEIADAAFVESSLHVVRLHNNIRKIGEKTFADASVKELHIRHEHPEELEIGAKAFENLKDCTLYVPIGTGYAYRHHPDFEGKFKEVIIEK